MIVATCTRQYKKLKVHQSDNRSAGSHQLGAAVCWSTSPSQQDATGGWKQQMPIEGEAQSSLNRLVVRVSRLAVVAAVAKTTTDSISDQNWRARSISREHRVEPQPQTLKTLDVSIENSTIGI